MKKNVVCLLALICSFSAAFSQKTYFVYLQIEQQQPFYVKLGDKTYSSSATGYLILSKLVDSSYSLTVGFPNDKWPEQKFTVNLGGKDKGYLLKNFQDGSWGLFDLQTLTIQMATVKAAANEPAGNVSLFTAILSKAANDPSLMEKSGAVKKEEPVMVVKEEPKKEESVVVVREDVKKEEPVIVVREEVKKEESVQEEKVLREYKKSVITKKSESSTSEGFGLTFIDDYLDGTKDTISIIIPNPAIQRRSIGDTQKEKTDVKKEISSSAVNVFNSRNKSNILHPLAALLAEKEYYFFKRVSQTLNS
jgi:hypothetical protein